MVAAGMKTMSRKDVSVCLFFFSLMLNVTLRQFETQQYSIIHLSGPTWYWYPGTDGLTAEEACCHCKGGCKNVRNWVEDVRYGCKFKFQ